MGFSAKPGKIPGKLWHLVTQAPEEQQEMDEWFPVPNLNSGTNQQTQLFYFYLFYILDFAYKSSVAERGL